MSSLPKSMSSNFAAAKRMTPDLPWCQDETDMLGPVVMNFIYQQQSFVNAWARKWFENFQFIYGNHAVKWSQKYGFAVESDQLRRPTVMSGRAQTNISRVVAEALASMIYSDLPTWDVDTADESSTKGRRYQKICQNLLDALMERLCYDKEFAIAAIIYVVYGQVAAEAGWDENTGEILQIPMERKVKVPVFTDYMAQNPALGGLLETPVQAQDSTGSPYLSERWEPVRDAQGKQIIKKVMTGGLRCRMRTPFEYMRAPGSHGMHKTRYITTVDLLDYDEYLYEYSKLGGQTGDFAKIRYLARDNQLYNFAVRHFMRLQFTTPPNLQEVFRRPESVLNGSFFKSKVVVINHFDKPNPEMWPEGRRLVVVNGRCTHVTRPQFRTNKLDGWHPFSEAQWFVVAPSSMASGPMNDVVAKNRELNTADSLIATSLRRNMGSMLLIRTGAGLDEQKVTGEPGQVHNVNDLDAAKFIHDAQPIPPVVASLRESNKEDVYETSGAQDALRGDRSKGASSGYMLRQLQEREERRLTPARKNFENFVSNHGEKQLICLKQNVIKLDSWVEGYLKRHAAGEFQPQDVQAFISTPIDFGVDVKVKKGSMALKSHATKLATTQEVAKGPAGGAIGTDRRVRDAFLRMFDLEELRDGSSAHSDRARAENELFADYGKFGPNGGGITLPVVMFEDDDDVHMEEHSDWAIRNWQDLLSNQQMMAQYLLHSEQHRVQKKEKAGEVMPGTTLAIPQMMAQASQQKPPTIPMIYQRTLAEEQQRAQQPPPGGQPGQPQAPKLPKAAGQPGAAPKDPNAPSETTAPPNPDKGGP